jgi:PAS domain S-box-containing protein
MMPNTGLGLLLVGVAGSLRYQEKRRRLLTALSAVAAAVVLVGAIGTLFEYVMHVDLLIDDLLMAAPGTVDPGRPSPLSALALAFLASAVLLLDVRAAARVRPSELLALSAGFIAFVAFLGYSFGAEPLYRLRSAHVRGVAIPTAVALLLISGGILFERPKAGLMRVVLSPGPGGTLVRRLIPVAAVAPIVMHWVVSRSFAHLGIRDQALVVAVVVASMVVLVLFLLSVTAPHLNQVHEALQSSRARISELLHQAPEGIFVADLDGRYREINEAGCRMLGYRRDEIIGKTIVDLIPPEDVDRLWRDKQKLLEGGVQVSEWTLRCKDGTRLPVEVSAGILPDGRWQAVVRDISQRKQADDRLREAQERLDLALRGADLATWDWNIATGEAIFNARWAEMRGLRPEEVEPSVSSWIAGIHPEDWRRVRKALDAHLGGQSSEYELEYRVRTTSGEWIFILDRGKVFARDEQGRPLRMAGTELDITARKQAEEEHRLAEAKSTGILSISADAIISIDENQRITLFNDGAARIFGYEKNEIVGAPLDTLIPERFRTRHRTHVERFALGREVARKMGARLEVLGLRKDGEEFPADAAISKLDVEGKRVLTVALRDVSEQKLLEEELRRAIESREHVLAVVAHDLRNPLSNILMQAQLLRRRASEPERRSRTPAETIERSATRMNRLIQDLLDLTQVEAGRLSIERESVATDEVVTQAVEAQKWLADSTSRELRLDLHDDLPDVLADRHRLLQVFENLIGNALKFTKPGGRITVGARPSEAVVLFWVADTGLGLAPDDIPHLFGWRWQADATAGGGAGLGLPIVKGIVEAHGGDIWVESTLGRGSTFFFTVPAATRAETWPGDRLPHRHH